MDEAELSEISVLARIGEPTAGRERDAWSSTRSALTNFAAEVIGATSSPRGSTGNKETAKLRRDRNRPGLVPAVIQNLAPETAKGLVLVPRVL